MSLLPQRKKTPEELAKLREELGILSHPEALGESVLGAASEPEPAPPPPLSATEAPAIPSLPIPAGLATEGGQEPTGAKPKQVWSLKRSEWAEPSEPSRRPRSREGSSALPARRRSERELLELRRASAADPEVSVSYLKSLTAHPLWIVLGYLLPLGGGLTSLIAPLFLASFAFNPLYAYLGGAVGIICGIYIFTKVRSRHHGGFISALAVLVLIFTVLQHLDPFQHAP